MWAAPAVATAGSLAAAVRCQQTGTPDFAAIDKFVEAEMQAQRIPGLALAMVHDDQIAYLKGYGVVDPSGRAVTAQTPFIIGSVSKSFTALAIMQLVALGKSNQQIADELVLATGTVKKHLNNIFGKLNAQNRTECVARARDLNLL